jgi:hypothetical protein
MADLTRILPTFLITMSSLLACLAVCSVAEANGLYPNAPPTAYKNISQYFVIPLEGIQAVLKSSSEFSTQTSNGQLVLIDIANSNGAKVREKRQFGELLQNAFRNEGQIGSDDGLVTRDFHASKKKFRTFPRSFDKGEHDVKLAKHFNFFKPAQIQKTNMPGHVTILQEAELEETATSFIFERSRKQPTRYRYSPGKHDTGRVPKFGGLFESQTAPKKSAFDGSNVSGREGTTLDLSNIPVEFRGM